MDNESTYILEKNKDVATLRVQRLNGQVETVSTFPANNETFVSHRVAIKENARQNGAKFVFKDQDLAARAAAASAERRKNNAK